MATFLGNLITSASTVLCLLSFTEAGCPPLFTNFNMACYYIGTTPVNSATAAYETCFALGGYLLNINAELEHNFTVDAIKKQPYVFDGYWIGGYYNSRYWMWQKVDSSGKTVDVFMNPQAGYYRWGPSQPDDGLDPLYGEYYVAIMTRGRLLPYEWYSENNNLQMRGGMSFVCEADWKE